VSIDPSQLATIQAGYAASSGFSIKQLEEQKREFDATQAWQREQMEKLGLPQLAIQQKLADLQQQQYQSQSALATRQQDWVENIGQQQQDLAKQVQMGNLDVSRQGLGLDVLKTAASLSGPANWIQAANFARGVSQSTLPAFVQQLLSGQSTAALSGPTPGSTGASPLTLGGLANQVTTGQVPGAPATAPAGAAAAPNTAAGTVQAMGGDMGPTLPNATFQSGTTYSLPTTDKTATPAAGTTAPITSPGSAPASMDPASASLYKLFSQGGQSLGAQSLEGLTSTEQQMLAGGGSALGFDANGFMDAYKRSRIGQTAAAAG
jgi:hypothetical protein